MERVTASFAVRQSQPCPIICRRVRSRISRSGVKSGYISAIVDHTGHVSAKKTEELATRNRQRAQMMGQALGLPTAMTLYAFIGCISG